ncbi:MAG: amidohydrolase [Desulfobulbaceae bacterium A2]|nr:MAG: amidohydrolase [Desulfobulbaceae bacterium A2]
MRPFSRRALLGALGTALPTLFASRVLARVWNPCRAGLPEHLAEHPAIRAAWDGLDPSRVWDCHVHLAGNGDSGSGMVLSQQLSSPRHPIQYVQRLFYFNAGCAETVPGQVDRCIISRMQQQLAAMPAGNKLLLLALDHVHDEQGQALPARSTLHVPNDFARSLARAYPQHFEWAASLHPYRPDAVEELERAWAEGARAVKWLPPAMGIDPASPRCDPFYRALARLRLPLISHAGAEHAMHGAGRAEFGNPLRLRRALDAGVRVVMAHCAAIGNDADLDHGGRRVTSFALFARMMDDPAHRNHLFADISALTQRNRPLTRVRTVLERDDWHPRLLNGSDYPLPGVMPLFAPAQFARAGMLHAELVPVLRELQGYNPLLFDFVLKRHLNVDGRRLPAAIFETGRFFLQETI